MNGNTHRLLGFLAGASVAVAQGRPALEVVLSGTFASAAAHGWLSPDVDQTKSWVRARQLARPVLAAASSRRVNLRPLLNHRYLSHWWGLPAFAAVAATTLGPEYRTATMMLVVGWSSHLAGDFVFGEGPHGGIPLLPWAGHVGLHLDTGGLWETGRTRAGRRVFPIGPATALLELGIVVAVSFSVWP